MDKNELIKQLSVIKDSVSDCDIDNKTSSVEFECNTKAAAQRAIAALRKIIKPSSVKRIVSGSDARDFEIFMKTKGDAVKLASLIDDIMRGQTGFENASSGKAKNSLASSKGSEQAKKSLAKALGRGNVSHAGNGVDWNGLLNNIVNTGGQVATSIFSGRTASGTTTSGTTTSGTTTSAGDDNTLLYVGLGGAVLLVVVLLVVLKK